VKKSALKRALGIRLGVLDQHMPKPWALRTVRCSLPDRSKLPTIAIVTPSLNQAAFIGRTVASVLGQNYPALQYLVQDGGSTDGSRQAAVTAGLPPDSFIVEKDGGQGDAINKGFNRITGDLMAYLNSDDLLLEGALAQVSSFFAEHPEVDVVYGNRLLIDEHDQLIGRWVLPYHSTALLCWIDYIPQETVFWRRRIWERVNGQISPNLSFALDWDLFSKFARAGAVFAHIPLFLGAFRIHSSQKTSESYLTKGKAEIRVIRKQNYSQWHFPVTSSARHMYFLFRHILEDRRVAKHYLF
jgi:glycosyltransferase involved in cell wall biosynthesis